MTRFPEENLCDANVGIIMYFSTSSLFQSQAIMLIHLAQDQLVPYHGDEVKPESHARPR